MITNAEDQEKMRETHQVPYVKQVKINSPMFPNPEAIEKALETLRKTYKVTESVKEDTKCVPNSLRTLVQQIAGKITHLEECVDAIGKALHGNEQPGREKELHEGPCPLTIMLAANLGRLEQLLEQVEQIYMTVGKEK